MPGTRRPLNHTSLAALPAIALDLETTGLDVANDRIVQIGGVVMRGPIVLSAPRINTRVDPGLPMPPASTRIHGITDADVADAPRFPELLESLVDALAGRVVIGQNIRFDLAVLRHEAARTGAPWRDPPVLDVAHLASALDRSLVDLSLESLAISRCVLVPRVAGQGRALGRLVRSCTPCVESSANHRSRRIVTSFRHSLYNAFNHLLRSWQAQEEQHCPVMEPALRDPMRYASSDPRRSYPIGTSGTHT